MTGFLLHCTYALLGSDGAQKRKRRTRSMTMRYVAHTKQEIALASVK
jgi:hypothetical protein